MARTKILFGHKQLADGVVRGRRHEAGRQGFEHRWSRSTRFWVKNRLTCDLRRATIWLSSGISPGIKKIPYFFNEFFGFPRYHITVGSHHYQFIRTGSDVNPTSLSVYHCRFKIRQWRGFWTGSYVKIWDSATFSNLLIRPLKHGFNS